jgi:hypothetical protein
LKINILLCFSLFLTMIILPGCFQGNTPTHKEVSPETLQPFCQIDNEKLLKALNDTIINDKNSEVIKDLKARKLYVDSHQAQPGEETNAAQDKSQENIPERYRTAGDNDIIPGFIDGGGIKQLIMDGVYHVEADGTLGMGPGPWDLLCLD